MRDASVIITLYILAIRLDCRQTCTKLVLRISYDILLGDNVLVSLPFKPLPLPPKQETILMICKFVPIIVISKFLKRIFLNIYWYGVICTSAQARSCECHRCAKNARASSYMWVVQPFFNWVLYLSYDSSKLIQACICSPFY